MTPDDPDSPGVNYTDTTGYRNITLRHTFEWESVDEARFNYEEFDFPEGTCITDVCAGADLILDVIGQPHALRKLSEPAPLWRRRRVMLVPFKILSILAVGTTLWRRVRRTRSQAANRR